MAEGKGRRLRVRPKAPVPQVLVVDVPEDLRTSDEQHTKYLVLSSALLDEVTDTDGRLVVQLPDIDETEATRILSGVKGIKLFSEDAYMS